MPREREKTSRKIKAVDYKINGNRIRAYYDSAQELIFVLDETINADKPNVLLVIDSFDERKWDDVLSNDYGIDLETVRPKKDNKYQKLDIEYGGLDVYAELFDAYESDGDLDDALDNLKRFRIMAVRRSAKERLAAAEDTASKARETIERTDDTISELRARLKELKAKLAEQKRNIGREPTKTSAAKILKTEAQIDATNEKLARAKKRLASAQRRLGNAEDDAEIARAILARHADVKPVRRVKTVSAPKRRAQIVREEVVEEEPDDEVEEEEEYIEEYNTSKDDDKDYAEEYSDTETYETETTTEEVTDEEEVKPLFDTDPEVLDDNIAFKPIDFNSSDMGANDTLARGYNDTPVAPAPLSFTPPPSTNHVDHEHEDSAPMLDSLTSVEQTTTTEENTTTTEQLDVTTTLEPSGTDNQPASAPVTETEMVTETVVETQEPTTVVEITPAEPVEPVAPVRPVSPITDTVIETEVRYTKKPTLIYYLLLIVLIALSIFTLWLYQQKNGSVVPDLGALTVSSETTTTTSDEQATETNIPSPFVSTSVEKTETVSETPEPVAEPEPVVEPEPEPVAVVVSEPKPVAEPEPTAEVEAEPVNVTVESPFVPLRTVATYEPEKKPIPTEEEILARKPGYNVSQQEKMFVAATVPEPEPVVVPATESFAEEYNNVESLAATYSMDTDVQPMPVVDEGFVPEIVASEVHEIVSESSNDIGTCADGAPADANGCCPGEEFVSTPDGYMCCVEDDCFPPLQ